MFPSLAAAVLLSISLLDLTSRVSGQGQGGCLQRMSGFEETVFRDKVFYISQDEKTWTEAERACEERGGRLAVLDDPETFDHVRTTLKSNYSERQSRFWIGLRWTGSWPGTYRWLSGKTHDHQNHSSFWQGGDDDMFGTYVAMVPSEFRFNNARNVNLSYFICERESRVHELGPHRDRRLLLVDQDSSWSQARDRCLACSRTRLLEVRDQDTQLFLETRVPDVLPPPRLRRYWLGLRANSSSSGPGGQTWLWASGEEFQCSSTSTSFPCHVISNVSLDDSGGECVTISTSHFQWEMSSCFSSRGFLCQQESTSISPSPTKPGLTDSSSSTEQTAGTSEGSGNEGDTDGGTGANNENVGALSATYISIIAVVAAVVCLTAAALLAVFFLRRRKRETTDAANVYDCLQRETRGENVYQQPNPAYSNA